MHARRCNVDNYDNPLTLWERQIEVWPDGLKERLVMFFDKQAHEIVIQLHDENGVSMKMFVVPRANNSIGIQCQKEEEVED